LTRLPTVWSIGDNPRLIREESTVDGSSTIDPAPGTIGIVAIASDDTFAHVYRDLPQMIEDGFGAAGGRRGGLEFFTAEGGRLVPVFGSAWQLVDLRGSGDKPDAALLGRRLAAVLEHVVAYLGKHPELVESSGLTIEEAIAQLPRPTEQGLAEVLDRFPHRIDTADDGTVRPLDRGGWFHNSLHAAGWTH
jgi:hypothetical protein